MRLLTASPVNVSDFVWDAAKQPMCHREPAFGRVLRETKRALLSMVFARGRCAILNGNGTLAVESALQTFVSGRCLIITNGSYAFRIVASLERLGCSTTMALCDNGWQYGAYCLDQIRDIVSTHDFDWVCMVHNETSVGRINDIGAVCDIVCPAGARVFVDAVSSFGAYDIDPRVSVVATCGNKCLESLCGCAIVMWRTNTRQAVRSISPVLNATNYASRIPNTVNVPAVLGLHAALGYGLWNEHEPRQPRRVFYDALSKALRESVGAHFPLTLNGGWSNSVTAFSATAKKWASYSRACVRAGFRIYNHTEDGASFGRICNMGYGISNDDMLHLGEIAKRCA